MRYAIAILILILLTACSSTINNVEKEESFNYSIHFCSEEDCLGELTRSLQEAKFSLKCAFYRVDNSVFDNTSVSAEIVVDEKARTKEAANAKVFKAGSKGIMHDKYCIIDSRTVATGSFNPVKSSIGDYNDILLVNSSSIAAIYLNDFNRLKVRSTGSPTGAIVKSKTAHSVVLNDTLVEVRFCPTDKCAEAVVNEIKKARESVLFATYSFTHPGIANELVLRASEGVRVEGIIEKSTSNSAYSKDEMLAANGVQARIENSKKLMHYKFFVIDNETVITGSFNPTQNADTRNDENLIIIHNRNLAARYISEWLKSFGH